MSDDTTRRMLPAMFRAHGDVFHRMPRDATDAAIAAAVAARERAGEFVARAFASGVLEVAGLAEQVAAHPREPARLWRELVGPLYVPRERFFHAVTDDGRGIMIETDEAYGGLLFNVAPDDFPPVEIATRTCPKYLDRDGFACTWLAAHIEANLAQTRATTADTTSPADWITVTAAALRMVARAGESEIPLALGTAKTAVSRAADARNVVHNGEGGSKRLLSPRSVDDFIVGWIDRKLSDD